MKTIISIVMATALSLIGASASANSYSCGGVRDKAMDFCHDIYGSDPFHLFCTKDHINMGLKHDGFFSCKDAHGIPYNTCKDMISYYRSHC